MGKEITRNKCLECSEHQKTCCTFVEHYIPLTIADMERIESNGFKLHEVATVAEFDRDWLIEVGEEQWWIDSMVDHNGKLYRVCLKSQAESTTCIMLKDKVGCVLGKERPNICRIYPFWISINGKLEMQDEFCHMHKTIKGVPISHYVAMMDETEEDIRRYFKEMQEDFVKNRHKHEEIVRRLLKQKSAGTDN